MEDKLKVVEQEAQTQLLDNSAIAQIELGVRLAQLRPRNVEKLTEELIKSATRTKEIAESCFYALKRAGKIIEGPGIDMAKLTAQKWGNLFIRTDIVRTTHKEIFGAAFIWDFEANTSIISVEPRRITYARSEKGHKAGERYNDDMINITGRAAQSIALRNAIFTVVPKADTMVAFKAINDVRIGRVAVKGEAVLPIETRVNNAIEYFNQMGVSTDRILWLLQVGDASEIGDIHLGTLLGLKTAIKEKISTIEQAFPPTPKEEAEQKDQQMSSDMLSDTKS